MAFIKKGIGKIKEKGDNLKEVLGVTKEENIYKTVADALRPICGEEGEDFTLAQDRCFDDNCYFYVNLKKEKGDCTVNRVKEIVSKLVDKKIKVRVEE